MSDLTVHSTTNRRDSKRIGSVLPGWVDDGSETVAFHMPRHIDLDRMRFKSPGDAVLLSRGDPIKEPVAEGTVTSVSRSKLVVNFSRKLPVNSKNARWRLDCYANRANYERQFSALIQLATQDKGDPLCTLLMSAEVGHLDAWAEKATLPPWHQAEVLQVNRKKPSSAPGMHQVMETEISNSLLSRCGRLAQEEPRSLDKEKLQQAREEISKDRSLNSSQRTAAEKALGRRCTIIQGPPGTGKTTVSVAILQYWVEKLGLNSVLATSDSNVAVDNIAIGLSGAGIRVVRVGRSDKTRPEVEDLLLDSYLARQRKAKQRKESEEDPEAELDLDRWWDYEDPFENPVEAQASAASHAIESTEVVESKPARTDVDAKQQLHEERQMRQSILREAQVICATTNGAGGALLSNFKFRAILVDEVAQATEISTVVPLVLRDARQVVLVGDGCQLPPMVISREAELRGLSLSIYGRLADAGVEPHFLDTQYRSHPKIAEFSAKCFYKGALRSGIPSSQRKIISGVIWPNPRIPVAFFEVGEIEVIEGESKANPAEVAKITELVRNVLDDGQLKPEDIGVVTPYMAQVRSLRRALRTALSDETARLIETASVDSFQGREKELIVFSAVRCNRFGNVGFLADWRRLNVMLTRAKRGLVVFGSAATLRHDCHWQQWLEWCHKHEAIDFKAAQTALAPPPPPRRPPVKRPMTAFSQSRQVPSSPAGARPSQPPPPPRAPVPTRKPLPTTVSTAIRPEDLKQLNQHKTPTERVAAAAALRGARQQKIRSLRLMAAAPSATPMATSQKRPLTAYSQSHPQARAKSRPTVGSSAWTSQNRPVPTTHIPYVSNVSQNKWEDNDKFHKYSDEWWR
eukprot:TRINITY_DN20892_c1_g1_i1.p1 TRINITY_DN20892_c1_g1~~TRINITY_DN20892_c1_g1_i1.p1  ORF type:complete len:867 (+),score=166.57 TRINITY_DN20892_c1_g1_i1:27-2603(+)